MSLLPDQSSTTDPPTSTLLTSDLIAFHDHFVEFQGACAFLCDSIVALTTVQLELDKASVHGLHMYAGQVKQRAQVLKEQLQELRGAYRLTGSDGGLGAKDIHAHKGLKKSEKILDRMGSTELAANLFRATQTEEKLRREDVRSKKHANETHFDVGRKVRQTIEELGGTMPENLPTPETSIRQLESARKKLSNEKKKGDNTQEKN